ncbi:MAG: hypothetical protein JSS85_09890 [Bacteroidetes bacterium]|nr:hypothetical protein [Bacteroidota bacterium]
MKKIFFTNLLFLLTTFLYGQTTYYWVGGTASTSFTSNTNWNTALDGSGTFRTAAASTDILIFDGTNVGGATPTTGLVTATASSTSAAALILQNGANVNIGRSSVGAATITIVGDGTPADDLFVGAGSTLTTGMAIYNFDVQIILPAGATGLVKGAVYLSPLSTSVHTRSYITASTANSLVFDTGSSCSITDSTASSGFNGSVAGSISFKSGSSLYYYSGRSPFGNNSTTQFINFEQGSNLYFRGSNVSYLDGSSYSSSSWINRKTFANVFIQNNATVKADGPANKIENFTIDNGCTFNTHTSGVTPILNDLIVNGTLNGPAASTNTIVMGGNTPQTIAGSGSIDLPTLTIANYSNVILSRSVNVLGSTSIAGKINFGNFQLTGSGDFTSMVNNTATSVTGNTVAGSYQITNVTGLLANNTGLAITGAGLSANTNVVGFSGSNAVILLSKPATTTASGVSFTFFSDTATMVTANPNGMDSITGSVVVTGNKDYQSGTNYIINAATTSPFGISSGNTNTFINAGSVEINADVTVNKSINIYNHILVNGKINLRPLDTLHLIGAANIAGVFGPAKYIVTAVDNSTGNKAIVMQDQVGTATVMPIGSPNFYLPVTITPSTAAGFSTTVFEGITSDGTVSGTPLTAMQKQTVVNAVWQVNSSNAGSNTNIQLNWDNALEGATFTTLPDTSIGIIYNQGGSYTLPIGTGDNTNNSATAIVNNLGSFSVGSKPPTQPFIFNAIPSKIYGDDDFSGGAISLNTTQPITYSSDNAAVATIVAGNIHITGAGTANITAAQASDGFYPAANISQILTVDKAGITITADNKIKFEQTANPVLTATYTGFVNNETEAVLLTPAILTTTAVLTSPAGNYPITVSGATAANYNITFVNGTLTVQPKQNQTITFNTLPIKTYGNADFAAGASSTNNTIPITYQSSNNNVATIIGNNIHITGAGTATITASQAGNDGYFAAANVSKTFTVNKANLNIKVRDTVKTEGAPNPEFTTVYTGFVLGETVANLLTAPMVATTATTNTVGGYYPIIPSGAASNNYNISYTNGRLTINPATGTINTSFKAWMVNSSTLMVTAYSPQPAIADAVLFDISGRRLAAKNVFLPAGFISFTINVPGFASGINVLKLTGKTVNLSQTILINK